MNPAAPLARRRWREAPDPCAAGGFSLPEGERFKVATSDGAVLDGMVAGSGPTAVLVHCWTGNRESWVPVAARLVARGRRVVLYDQRGHGASTLGTLPPTVDQLATDLAAVLEATRADLDHAGSGGAVVAGHSLGGMVAQRLAAGHPSIPLAGLVLVATGAARLARGALAPVTPWAVASPRVERVLAGAAGPALMRRCVGRRPCLAHMVATRDAFVATPAITRAAVLRSIRALDLRAQLASVSVPTTVVVGGRDRLTPSRFGRTIARAVPGARLVEVADAGHMLPLEAPDILADLIALEETR